MIYRNIEEALHLLRVQVHGQHPAHASGIQQIRHELRRNWNTRLIFAVLAGIAEKWNDRRDPIRAGTPCRVNHNEQLHQVLVGWRTSRLDNENIVAPNIFLNPDVGLAVRKRADCRLTKWYADIFANALGQLPVSGSGKDLQFWLERKHGAVKLGGWKQPWQSSKTCQLVFL